MASVIWWLTSISFAEKTPGKRVCHQKSARPLASPAHFAVLSASASCTAPPTNLSPVRCADLPLAVVALLMYVVGIPVGLLAIMWLNRRRLKRPQFRAAFGLLYESY